jgi:hypothetical protein
MYINLPPHSHFRALVYLFIYLSTALKKIYTWAYYYILVGPGPILMVAATAPAFTGRIVLAATPIIVAAVAICCYPSSSSSSLSTMLASSRSLLTSAALVVWRVDRSEGQAECDGAGRHLLVGRFERVNRVLPPHIMLGHAAKIDVRIQNFDVFPAQGPDVLLHPPLVSVQLLLHVFSVVAAADVGDMAWVIAAAA